MGQMDRKEYGFYTLIHVREVQTLHRTDTSVQSTVVDRGHLNFTVQNRGNPDTSLLRRD